MDRRAATADFVTAVLVRETAAVAVLATPGLRSREGARVVTAPTNEARYATTAL
eukprot:COSAG03_NODE_356_length_8629_cov_11.099965_9_plen_54_part_00